jgi:eukaryotic-like serine/threonine-protein kinase
VADPARVKEIFDAALDTPEPLRKRLLDAACGEDAALRREVEDLLEALAERPLLDAVTLSAPSTRTAGDAPIEGPGARIHQYRLLETIGEGGFGTVFAPRWSRTWISPFRPGRPTRGARSGSGCRARFPMARQAPTRSASP